MLGVFDLGCLDTELMKTKIRAGIVGGTGYTGGELIRLLLNHPFVELKYATSRSKAGEKISACHPDLIGETELQFIPEIEGEVDVLFLCLPHKTSRPWLEEHDIPLSTKIIDMGNDFRLEGKFGKRNFIYGMSEIYKEEIKNANDIANCGCFASGLQYGLLPLAKEKLLTQVFSTGITGSTGAGVKPSPTTHYSWRNNNVSAYKTLTHQHIGEISINLKKFNGKEVKVHFVPWRGDFPRGIFVSSTLECDWSLEKLVKLFKDFYADAPFVYISDAPMTMKQVVNNNKCVIQLEKNDNMLVVHSAVDNLLKGASGQAVQNMNLMFGFEETTGLHLKPSAY